MKEVSVVPIREKEGNVSSPTTVKPGSRYHLVSRGQGTNRAPFNCLYWR